METLVVAFINIMVGFLVLASIGFVIWALVDAIKSDDSNLQHLPKIGWVLIIIFGNFFIPIGAILYFAIGKVKSPKPRQNRKNRPTGPDDDPDFLKGL